MTNKARIEQLEKQVEELLQANKNTVIEMVGETKPKFEIGNWYKTNNNVGTFCITSLSPLRAYGIANDGIWKDETRKNGGFRISMNRSQKEASNKEVEEALIKEAERRGFRKNIDKSWDSRPIISFNNSKPEHVGAFWDFEKNTLKTTGTGYLTIFKDGKWAEIIEDTLTIHGETLKIEGDIVSFGCAKFDTWWLKQVYREVNFLNNKSDNTPQNRKIKSIILDSGKELTIEDLKNIVEYINK